MSMRRKAEDLIEGIKRLINKIIMREVDLGSLARLDSEDLSMLKETNDLLEGSYEFMIEEVDSIEETHDQVEEIRSDVIEINRKLNIILEKMQEKDED